MVLGDKVNIRRFGRFSAVEMDDIMVVVVHRCGRGTLALRDTNPIGVIEFKDMVDAVAPCSSRVKGSSPIAVRFLVIILAGGLDITVEFDTQFELADRLIGHIRYPNRAGERIVIHIDIDRSDTRDRVNHPGFIIESDETDRTDC